MPCSGSFVVNPWEAWAAALKANGLPLAEAEIAASAGVTEDSAGRGQEAPKVKEAEDTHGPCGGIHRHRAGGRVSTQELAHRTSRRG